MPSAAAEAVRSAWSRYRGLIVPALAAGSILVVVAPLPTGLLDLLLSANITVAVVMLLTTLYARKPLDFSVFPSLLLGTTLARLVLNVASTRLILTNGADHGTWAAGGVIRAFGEFVAGGNLTVGLVIFCILVAIQFLVVTKGATRIGEVSARFALDGLPGRQMAIDADLNAGAIDAATAALRREELVRQADFYGAMDGASRFVRGDAIAGLVITVINIVGGMYVGAIQQGMPLGEAADVFTKLTIGDGLVTQVPAFLISLAAGLLVTRSSVESDLPGQMLDQMFVRPEAMGVGALFVLALSFTGLPKLPLLLLAGGLAVLAVTLTRQQRPAADEDVHEEEPSTPAPPARTLESQLRTSPLELELGYGLVRLADASVGGDLVDRVTRVRHRLAQELGIILPSVRIRDNIRIEQKEYQIRIHDVPVARGIAFPDGLLAIGAGGAPSGVRGVRVDEPAFGESALWIEPRERERAESAGCRVVEPAAAIAMHLAQVARRHSDELLSREQVHQLLDNLKQHAPRVVEELVPGLLQPAQVHQVLCRLLTEQVSIRNLEGILEALSEHAAGIGDIARLTEIARQAMCRTICQQYRDADRVLRVVTLDPAAEDLVASQIEHTSRGAIARLSPPAAAAIVESIAEQIELLTAAGHPAVLLTTPEIRYALKQMTSARLPELAVLSLSEITRDTHVESAGQAGAAAIIDRESRNAAVLV